MASKKILNKIDKDNVTRCRYCNKELKGFECGCKQRFENQKLWDKTLREKLKRKGKL